MKNRFEALLLAAALAIFAGPALAADAPPKATNYSMKEGAELSSWSHPVHDVLKKYGVVLKSVTVKDNYATFEVEFPFDPSTGPNGKKLRELLFEILKANGWWDYTIRGKGDGVGFEVQWDRQKKLMIIDSL